MLRLLMEKPFTGMKYPSNFWFVFLVSIVSSLSMLLIYYISIIGSKFEIKLLVENYVTASLESKINVNSQHVNAEQMANRKSTPDLCLGRYIYIQELPSRFNEDILKNCHLLTRKCDKLDMCQYTMNLGFGPQIENSSGVLSNISWYATHQFSLEVIFHNRMKKYDCLTNDSSVASAIFVPFYVGLDLRRYLWGFKASVRDSSGFDLLKLLAEKPEWKKMWGRDHFFVAGRISRDFRRRSDSNTEWGSKFRFLPESKNMSMLSIESSSWKNDLAIPYPTHFHPSKEIEVFQWQERMRRVKRQHLFCFAGAPRYHDKTSIRANIIYQCLESKGTCKLLNCRDATANCDDPVNVMQLFQSSVFCLQPPGDSLTRRSIFDSMLAGCIPVFFHPGTAYTQYTWHLPNNHTEYSVFIPGKSVSESNLRINETLLQVSKEEEAAMRERVIKLIPRIIYADPRSRLETIEDAFDLAVKGILERIDTFRKAITEGRDPSIGFGEKRN